MQIMASNNHMLIATRGASGGTAMTTPLSPGESANNAEPYDAPCYDADPTVVVGLITLEDIIEEVGSRIQQHCMAVCCTNASSHKSPASTSHLRFQAAIAIDMALSGM
jgi:hypothetical protein